MDRLFAGGAGAVPKDGGPLAARVLRRTPIGAEGDRRGGRLAAKTGLKRMGIAESGNAQQRDEPEGAVHCRRGSPAETADPGRTVYRALSCERGYAARGRAPITA